MAADLDLNPGGGATNRRRISKKALSQLDDDVIDRILLQPDRRKYEPSWWRRFLTWLMKEQDTDGD
jgi:hypothetical protein